MEIEELKLKCQEKILDAYILAEQIFKRNFVLPTISFDLKSQRLGGFARYSENLIKLNPYFLQTEQEKFIDRTPVHEVAHLISRSIYPNAKQHHGPQWKYVASKLGIEPVRCHSYSTNDVAQLLGKKMFKYVCPICGKEFYLSKCKHNRVRFDGTVYGCTNKHFKFTPIVFSGQ